jgi:hypothetical protein
MVCVGFLSPLLGQAGGDVPVIRWLNPLGRRPYVHRVALRQRITRQPSCGPRQCCGDAIDSRKIKVCFALILPT